MTLTWTGLAFPCLDLGLDSDLTTKTWDLLGSCKTVTLSHLCPFHSNIHIQTHNIHYYSLSHTLLFSLTYPNILSHIHCYTLSHTLLYSLTYTTILSHTRLYTLIHACKRSIIVCVYEYSGVYARL